MLNNNIKLAETTYVPLVAYDRVAGHGKALAGTALTVGGLSLSVLALKQLLEGIMDARMEEEVKPSTAIQHDLHTRTAVIDNDFVKVADPDERRWPFSFSKIFGLEDDTRPTLMEALTNKGRVKVLSANTNVPFNSITTDRSSYYVDPATRVSDNSISDNILAPLAENPQMASILLPSLFMASAIGAPILAKRLVNYLSNSVMEQPERTTNYTEAAKEVYDQAAKDLRKLKEKEASGPLPEPGDHVTVHSNDGFLSPFNLLPASIGLLLAYATYHGIQGFNKGFDSAGSDIAEQQHFLHGWKAQRKLRDYDYMPLYVDYEKEPISKSQKNKKTRKALELLEDIQDTEGIEVNPFAIEDAT